MTPGLTDPVVIDGVKYRIRVIQPDGVAQLRTSFSPRLEAKARLTELVWDRQAGVWRIRGAA